MTNYQKIKESVDNIYSFIDKLTEEERKEMQEQALNETESTIMYILLPDEDEQVIDLIIDQTEEELNV